MVFMVAKVRIGMASLSSFMASLRYSQLVFLIHVSGAKVLGNPHFDDGALAFATYVVFMSRTLEGDTASVMSPIM